MGFDGVGYRRGKNFTIRNIVVDDKHCSARRNVSESKYKVYFKKRDNVVNKVFNLLIIIIINRIICILFNVSNTSFMFFFI